MRTRNFVLLSLLILVPVVSFAVKKFNTVTEDSQITLTVIRFEDHISIQCSPAGSDTSSHTHWKAICNEMANPQINKLVADGAIKPINGPVYDTATTAAATTQLSREIPLSQSHR
jgi:hypothetical protein